MEEDPNQEDTGGATTPTAASEALTASETLTASNHPPQQPPTEFNNHIEPDSLMMTSAELDRALWDKEDEIVQAFENEENDVEVIDRATSVDMSVASR